MTASIDHKYGQPDQDTVRGSNTMWNVPSQKRSVRMQQKLKMGSESNYSMNVG